MTGCCGFGDAVNGHFTDKKAAEELNRYRTKGPGVTTRLLRDGLANAGLLDGTLLDVGAGIGALTFELLERGVTSAVAVDASAAYLAVAKQEAARRGRSHTTTFVQGDFVELAAELPVAETVTLDRVVCCYPSYRPLLAQALQHAARGFAFSYPRDRWFVRWSIHVENAVRQVRSNPFRTVVHPVEEMQHMIRDAAFALVSRSQTATWAAEVYARPSSTSSTTFAAAPR